MRWKNLRSATQANIRKAQFSIFFINWEILKSPDRSIFKNPKFFLRIGKNLKVLPKTNTQKIPGLDVWMNSQNLCL